MTVSIRIDAASGMAIATGHGVLGLDDSMKGAEALWQTEEWPGERVVWDFRDAEFDLASTEVIELAEFVVRNQRATPPARVAFVAPHDVEFGLARMFDGFREDGRTEVRVFRDYDEAVCWVRSPQLEGP